MSEGVSSPAGERRLTLLGGLLPVYLIVFNFTCRTSLVSFVALDLYTTWVFIHNILVFPMKTFGFTQKLVRPIRTANLIIKK